MKCSLESQMTYPVEVWKLFFQKTTPAVDEALDSLATMVNPILRFHEICVSPCDFSIMPKVTFYNPRSPTAASHPHHMLLRLLERWELPTSARHSCRITLLSAAGSRQRCVRFWPLPPSTSYHAWAPGTSAARRTRLCKQTCDVTVHSEPGCRVTNTFIIV